MDVDYPFEQWVDPETGDCDYCDNTNVAVRPDVHGLLVCRRCTEQFDGTGSPETEVGRS